jgi:sugar lactone lactonase YvrE
MNSSRPVVGLDQVEFVGESLVRPESVLVTSSGRIFVSDLDCGVVEIGGPRKLLKGKPEGFVANGIAITRAGEFLIANPGGCGGVWRLDRGHNLYPFLLELDGREVRNCNSVEIDGAGRIWISVSTRQYPRDLAFNGKTQDGYLILLEQGNPRIVADGIGFTNESRIDPSGSYLYLNETFSRKLTRFRVVNRNGRSELSDRETVHEFGDGDFPDGLTFDAEGGVWVACIVSNRVVRIAADDTREIILDDSDPQLIARVESRFAEGLLERKDLELGAKRSLHNVSSIAFGGPDLKTVYLGNLGGNRIITFRAPIAGLRPHYWEYDGIAE